MWALKFNSQICSPQSGCYSNNVDSQLTCSDSGVCTGPGGGTDMAAGLVTLTFSGRNVTWSTPQNEAEGGASRHCDGLHGQGQANAAFPDATIASGMAGSKGCPYMADLNLGPITVPNFEWQATLVSSSITVSPPPGTGGTTPGSTSVPQGEPLPSDLAQLPPPAFPDVRTIAGGGWHTIYVGTDVGDNVGWKLATDSITSAHIIFRDGTKLDIGPNSRVKIGPQGSPIRTWFEEGILHFKESLFCGPPSCTNRYFRGRLIDGWATVAVRGTEFTLASDPSGYVIVTVLSGVVDIGQATGMRTHRVTAGHKVFVGGSGFVFDSTSWQLSDIPWWNLPDDRLLAAGGLLVYFFPLLLAVILGRRKWLAVGAIDLLLGWTVIGWLVALFLAIKLRRPQAQVRTVGTLSANGLWRWDGKDWQPAVAERRPDPTSSTSAD